MTQPPPSSSSSSPPMAPAVLLLLMLAMAGVSDGAWCVCKPDASSSDLQKTIDYACGTQANCAPILQNGACYNPNTVLSHCSYAANSYYQNNNQNQQACVFSGTTQLVTADPSSSGCSYPSTPSAAGGNGTGTGTGTPGTSPPSAPGSSLTPPPPGTSFSPGTGTGTGTGTSTGTGIGTGTGTGAGFGSLGPTGAGLDSNAAATGLLPQVAKLGSLILLSAIVFLRRV